MTVMNETDAALTGGARRLASHGDEVNVKYATSHGNRKTRRGEIKGASDGTLTVVFPDGQSFEIVGTNIKGSNNKLKAIEFPDADEKELLIAALRAHSRVDSVEKDGDEWVAYIEGNSPPIRQLIESKGGTITDSGPSPWNPDEDPRPLRFRR